MDDQGHEEFSLLLITTIWRRKLFKKIFEGVSLTTQNYSILLYSLLSLLPLKGTIVKHEIRCCLSVISFGNFFLCVFPSMGKIHTSRIFWSFLRLFLLSPFLPSSIFLSIPPLAFGLIQLQVKNKKEASKIGLHPRSPFISSRRYFLLQSL